MSAYILEMKNITKTFPGVIALNNVSLQVKRGEIHALVGENGAGKSTLMKVLNGVYQADSGEILIDGQTVKIRNTTDAERLGIGLVFQECNLVNSLSVAENMFLNKLNGGRGLVNWKQINATTQEFLDSLCFDFRATAKIEALSASQKQMVEIAKVLYKKPRVIVMDEPTSSLTTGETRHLFEIMHTLKETGTTIVYISHKMDEIFEMCDTATVVRDGNVIETRPTKDFTRDEIVERMVGRSVDTEYPKRSCKPGEVVLKLDNVVRSGIVGPISFELHRGEILGLAGLVGSGRTEIAEAIFGAEHYDGGVIEDEFLYGMVTNSSSVAKFLALSDVRWDDGLFEVTLIHKPSNLVEFHKLVMAFSKIQLGLAKQYLHYFRTSHLKVTALDDEPVSWTIDGEYGGTERVNEIANRKQTVTFHVDPVCREQAEENAESGFAVVKPLPEDAHPEGIETQPDHGAETEDSDLDYLDSE